MEVKIMVVEIKMIFIMQEDSLGSLWRRSQRSADDGRKGLIKCGMGKSTNFKGEQALTKKKKKRNLILWECQHPLWILEFGKWANEKRQSFDYVICHILSIMHSPFKPAWMLQVHASRCAKRLCHRHVRYGWNPCCQVSHCLTSVKPTCC